MDAIRECCAGMDVHQETVVVCILKGPLDIKPRPQIRTFGTTTKELLQLQDWLAEYDCKEVAMESTGVLWKPIWNVLESTCNLILANPKHIKNLPGRKTDIKDAQWIAQLHRCGLIEASMVPTQNIRDLRDLTRYRRKLVQAITSEKNRIHKILQDGNIKLTTFMSDVFGVSGRALLQKLINGEVLDEPEVRALVKAKLKRKIPQLLDALNGKLRLHHREMMSYHWEHIEYLEKQVEQLEAKIDSCVQDYQNEVGWLDSIPGIDEHTAAAIFAEIGPNVTDYFPTDTQFASWAGICPGNNESAGKKKSTKILQGNKQLKSSLCQAAWANARADNRIGQFYRQVQKRRGEKKAIVATGHLMLRMIYAMMRDKTEYKEIDVHGGTSQEKILKYYLKQIQGMGFEIQINTKEVS